MKPWQEAMTSEQVLLTASTLCLTTLATCAASCTSLQFELGWRRKAVAPRLTSPYDQRQVWAVVPLRNESGSLHADGLKLADHLARQLENASNIDVLPVNRSLVAMEAMEMNRVSSPNEARALLRMVEADALVVGTVTAYDPYDPPKLGLAIELYHGSRWASPRNGVNPRQLSQAPTGPETLPVERSGHGPDDSVVSAFLDASDPSVRDAMRAYASSRGAYEHEGEWHRYRISMDLFSEFASYVVSRRLLREEAQQIQATQATPAQ